MLFCRPPALISLQNAPCAQVLADFWWAHVVPAKHEMARIEAMRNEADTRCGGSPYDGSGAASSQGGDAVADMLSKPGNIILDPAVREVAMVYRPQPNHVMTNALIIASKAMAHAAPATIFAAN